MPETSWDVHILHELMCAVSGGTHVCGRSTSIVRSRLHISACECQVHPEWRIRVHRQGCNLVQLHMHGEAKRAYRQVSQGIACSVTRHLSGEEGRVVLEGVPAAQHRLEEPSGPM